VLERSAEAGAIAAGYVALRLPLEIKDLFREWLQTDHPDRARRVMSLVRQMRGGRDYDPEWRKRQTGDGPLAQLIARRMELARERYGLAGEWRRLDVTQFRVPEKAGDQMALL
jgi:DNA repair photolyase